jgi:rubredoxin
VSIPHSLKDGKRCPDCGSNNTRYSEGGFPALAVPGPAWFCRNCRLLFQEGASS